MTQLSIYSQKYPLALKKSLGLCPKELPHTRDICLQYIPRLVMMQKNKFLIPTDITLLLINRPGVAKAVLQTSLLLIN